MAADDGRGSQRGERQSAGSARGNSNTNNSARGDARESRSQESSRSGSGSGVGTNAPSRGTGSNAGPSRSSGASDRNNGQTAGRESRGVAAGSVGAVGRENDRSIGRGLAGAAGLAGASLGGNVTSTYQGRPSSVASAALSRQALAPDRAMPTGPVRNTLSATGYGPLGDMAANAYGAVKSAIAPTFNRAMDFNREIDGFVDKMIGVESGYNPNAKNPKSTATGLGQFLSSTWTRTVEKYRPDLASMPKADLQALRKDPVLARQITKSYAIENANYLQSKNLPVTKETVYAAHFLGPVGAVKAYSADPSTPAVDVLGSAAVTANPTIMSGKTIGDVLGYVSRVMNKSENGGFATTPANAPTPTDKPSASERFASTYLGRPASVASEVARNNLARSLPSPASSFPARPAGPVSTNLTDPLDRPATLPSRELMSDQEQAAVYGEQPGGTPVAPAAVHPTYSVRTVSPTPNSPTPVSTVPSTAVPAVKATPVTPSTETTVKAPLTTPQKVLAGAIDIGTSLIPGVGLAAGIYNGLATLTGQPTIGGMAVDLLGNGSNLGTGGPRRNEEGGRRSTYEPEAPKPPETTVKTPEVERFRERYLIPSINRPTPAEKWGRRQVV